MAVQQSIPCDSVAPGCQALHATPTRKIYGQSQKTIRHCNAVHGQLQQRETAPFGDSEPLGNFYFWRLRYKLLQTDAQQVSVSTRKQDPPTTIAAGSGGRQRRQSNKNKMCNDDELHPTCISGRSSAVMLHVEVNRVERSIDVPDPLDGGISTLHWLLKLRHLRHGFVTDNADKTQQAPRLTTGLLPG